LNRRHPMLLCATLGLGRTPFFSPKHKGAPPNGED
jgi:hypothetical protein